MGAAAGVLCNNAECSMLCTGIDDLIAVHVDQPVAAVRVSCSGPSGVAAVRCPEDGACQVSGGQRHG
jgi:hypothetical protein